MELYFTFNGRYYLFIFIPSNVKSVIQFQPQSGIIWGEHPSQCGGEGGKQWSSSQRPLHIPGQAALGQQLFSKQLSIPRSRNPPSPLPLQYNFLCRTQSALSARQTLAVSGAALFYLRLAIFCLLQPSKYDPALSLSTAIKINKIFLQRKQESIEEPSACKLIIFIIDWNKYQFILTL